MKNKKGFTLIELLAVIVILGLLMAIAIPSVTKYITESRKKTVVSTIGNYITAMVNEVNDLTYTFTGDNTIYAVPVECIALERGGTNPFGAWHQANNSYWAYVLVQYDDETSSYRYGYTFKDSAGYGLYPTSQAKLNEQGKQIQTGLKLSLPLSGKATNIASIDRWNGFDVNSDTNLIVFVAESEGEVGNGKTTCTLSQKGKNYTTVEEEKISRPRGVLSDLIFIDNDLVNSLASLKLSSEVANETGLYKSIETNSGKPTYYFRGKVLNNYVNFANKVWRIVRINEDGTIRIILNGRIDTISYQFNDVFDTYEKMYYSNDSVVKKKIDEWYKLNVFEQGYDTYVAAGNFCEQAKVKRTPGVLTGNASAIDVEKYTADFRCVTDANGKGILSSKVGLINYDEAIHAGADYGKASFHSYLYSKSYSFWTMSPAGFKTSDNLSYAWFVNADTLVFDYAVNKTFSLRPVINLNSDVLASGTGTLSDPYVVKTK